MKSLFVWLLSLVTFSQIVANAQVVVSGSTQFPVTAIGTTSASQSLFLKLSTAEAITSVTAAQSQGGKQEFVVGAITGCVVDGTTINPAGSICTVPITFQPAYPGLREASLYVASPAGSFFLGLSGVGSGPQIAFTPGIISTVVEQGLKKTGFGGDGGPAANALLNNPGRLAIDSAGNLYIADQDNARIRKVDAISGIITTVAGNGYQQYSGDGDPAVDAALNYPEAIALDSTGNLYIADSFNNRIREVSADTGIIATLAGNYASGFAGDGGEAPYSLLAGPGGVAVDGYGDVYIADTGNERIRKIDGVTGIITTVAGNGTEGFSGDGGPATSAELDLPHDVALDAVGNVYFFDANNRRIRKIAAATGTISTVVSNVLIEGLAADSGGAVYFSELGITTSTGLDLVQKLDAGTGMITTVAGGGSLGGDLSDGGPANLAGVDCPSGVAVDSAGNVFFAENFTCPIRGNNDVRKVDVSALLPSVEFATTDPGQTSSKTVTVGNTGNSALTFPTPASGNNPSLPSGFSVSNASTCPNVGSASNPGTLAGGTSCVYAIDFAPPSPGCFFGAFTLTDTTLNALYPYVTQSTFFVATGVGGTAVPTVALSTKGLQFGAQPFGALSQPQSFTLTNCGQSPLTISSITSGYGSFGNESDNCPQEGSPIGDTLAPTASCTISVRFTPEIAGLNTGTLTIEDDASDSPQTVILSGTGDAFPLQLSPNGLDFGTQALFTMSAAETITVTNTGSNLSSVQVYGGTNGFEENDDCGGVMATGASCTISVDFFPTAIGFATDQLTITETEDNNGVQFVGNQTVALSGTGTTALQFVPVTPCRVADTRNATGPFGGPQLAAQATREFDISSSACGIPAAAAAYSLNVTVVPDGSLNYLTLWPAGEPQPLVSTLNSDGRIKANAAIVLAGNNGGVDVFVTDPAQVILDIDGYFVPAGTASALSFYPVTPCRIADTRQTVGPLGGPFLAAGSIRVFPALSSNCGLPATARAYSLNVTAVPHSTLNYLSIWPTGVAQPNVSTLNSSTGAVTANAAIVPAGNDGDVSVFVYDDADVILDVNGYFAPPANGGLSLNSISLCRVIDTRTDTGAFSGTLPIVVEASTCAPPTAEAYIFNATVVPQGSVNYLTLWSDGGAQPYVSTLNADDGSIASNMAIVPTENGSIDAFADGFTNLILDISGYFAP